MTAQLPTVAALYVEKGGVYYDVPGVDPWDEERDARLYAGPWPVVAHPPCARWSSFAGFVEATHGKRGTIEKYRRGNDGGCFAAALDAVRRFGGVLEHPADSAAWAKFDLPRPSVKAGWTLAFDGGASCYIEQQVYGELPVKKATWLYVYGCELPDLRWRFLRDSEGDASNQDEYGGMHGWRDKFTRRADASKTPLAFRDVLLSIARSAYALREPSYTSAEGQRPTADPDRRGAPSNVEDNATAVRRPFRGRRNG